MPSVPVWSCVQTKAELEAETTESSSSDDEVPISTTNADGGSN